VYGRTWDRSGRAGEAATPGNPHGYWGRGPLTLLSLGTGLGLIRGDSGGFRHQKRVSAQTEAQLPRAVRSPASRSTLARCSVCSASRSATRTPDTSSPPCWSKGHRTRCPLPRCSRKGVERSLYAVGLTPVERVELLADHRRWPTGAVRSRRRVR